MKTRNGFVSNSSSSSFCIIGKAYHGTVKKALAVAKKYKRDPYIMALGKYLSEGQDVFMVSPEMAKYIDSHDDDFELYLTIYQGSEITTISRDCFPVGIETLDIINGTADQHSSYDISQLTEYYEGDTDNSPSDKIDDQESIALLEAWFSDGKKKDDVGLHVSKFSQE